MASAMLDLPEPFGPTMAVIVRPNWNSALPGKGLVALQVEGLQAGRLARRLIHAGQSSTPAAGWMRASASAAAW